MPSQCTHGSTLRCLAALVMALQTVAAQPVGATAPVRAISSSAISSSAVSSGAIYRCEGERGVPRFSQFPCREPDRGAGRVNLDPLEVIRVAPLSAAERRRLEHLERERQARRQARARAERQARVESRRHRRVRIERCRAARAGLEALQDERRKGYSLREAALLERREAELDATIETNC